MPITTQSHKHQAIADKYVGQACTMRTLDGYKDAIICGRLQPFAVISTIPSGHTIQVNWPTVARKMESDKLFYAY